MLTACQIFHGEAYEAVYKSTGFRSQGKPFETRSGLVHRFETSLTLDHDSSVTRQFDRLRAFLTESPHRRDNDDHFLHPFIQFSRRFCSFLAEILDVSEIALVSNETELLKNGIDKVCCFSDLVMNNQQHQMSFKLNSAAQLPTLFKYELYINGALNLESDLIKQVIQLTVSREFDVSIGSFVEFKQDSLVIVSVSALLCFSFGLSDERLLFTNDLRNFFLDNQSGLWSIRPLIAQASVWFHDLSFWWLSLEDCSSELVKVVGNVCGSLVRHVTLLDVFNKSDEQQQQKTAFCFRLAYESCDRALSWEQTVVNKYETLKLNKHLFIIIILFKTRLQLRLRQELAKNGNIVLR